VSFEWPRKSWTNNVSGGRQDNRKLPAGWRSGNYSGDPDQTLPIIVACVKAKRWSYFRNRGK
jgi:hypothetical protein